MAGAVRVDTFRATGLDGRASYTPERTERLWSQIPAELRLERFTLETVAGEHWPAFESAGQFRSLDLTTLPLGLRRERLKKRRCDLAGRQLSRLVPSDSADRARRHFRSSGLCLLVV